jgi:hypothetical protein
LTFCGVVPLDQRTENYNAYSGSGSWNTSGGDLDRMGVFMLYGISPGDPANGTGGKMATKPNPIPAQLIKLEMLMVVPRFPQGHVCTILFM